MRRIMKENKGYSLVEMIIVIAIIAVMSAAAMVTITLINSAKAKEASVTLNSEISALVARAKSQIPTFDDGSGTVEQHRDYNFAIAVYKTGDKFYIAKGYYKIDSGNKVFQTFDADNANSGKGQSLSSKVSVTYVPGSKNSGAFEAADTFGLTADAGKKWVIAYDQNGRCICGVGTFEINKASDNSTLDEISINANGSHISK